MRLLSFYINWAMYKYEKWNRNLNIIPCDKYDIISRQKWTKENPVSTYDFALHEYVQFTDGNYHLNYSSCLVSLTIKKSNIPYHGINKITMTDVDKHFVYFFVVGVSVSLRFIISQCTRLQIRII